MLATPPRLPPSLLMEENAGTPGPTKARINNLQNQVSELVRQNHALEVGRCTCRQADIAFQRKVKSEKTTLQAELTQAREAQVTVQKALDRSQAHNKILEKELESGDGKRDEVSMAD